MQPLGRLSRTRFVTFVTSQQPPSKMLKNGTKAQTDANGQRVKRRRQILLACSCALYFDLLVLY